MTRNTLYPPPNAGWSSRIQCFHIVKCSPPIRCSMSPTWTVQILRFPRYFRNSGLRCCCCYCSVRGCLHSNLPQLLQHHSGGCSANCCRRHGMMSCYLLSCACCSRPHRHCLGTAAVGRPTHHRHRHRLHRCSDAVPCDFHDHHHQQRCCFSAIRYRPRRR